VPLRSSSHPGRGKCYKNVVYGWETEAWDDMPKLMEGVYGTASTLKSHTLYSVSKLAN